jgi:hypothetical protein
MVQTVKKNLKSNALGRWLFPKIGFFWHLYKDPARRRALQKYGYTNLKLVMEIVEKEKFPIIPWAGTLLGFVRDGGFMKHDDDIDFALLPGKDPKEVTRIFVEKYGFEFVHGFSYNGKYSEFCIKKNGLTMDFFVMFEDGKKEGFYSQYDFFWKDGYRYSIPTENHVGWYSYPKMQELTPLEINGIKVQIPAKIEEALYYLYGEGWKVPDPKYKGEGRPGRMGEAEGFGYSVTYQDVIIDNFPK